MHQPGEAIDINELARRLKVSPITIRRRLAAGELPQPKRIGRLVRWPLSTIVAWEQEQPEPTSPQSESDAC